MGEEPSGVACTATSRPGATARRPPRTFSTRCRRRAGCRSRRRSTPSSTRTASRRSMSVSQCGKRGAQLALTQRRLSVVGSPAGVAALADSRLRARWRRRPAGLHADDARSEVLPPRPAVRRSCSRMREAAGTTCRTTGRALERIARHRASLSVAEFASLLDDLRALRAGGRSVAAHRDGVGALRRTVARLERAQGRLDLAEFHGNTLVADAPAGVRAFARRCSVRARGRSASSPSRARATTTSSRAARSCALSRRTIPSLRRRRAGCAGVDRRPQGGRRRAGRRRPCDGGAHRGRRAARGDLCNGEIDAGPARTPLPDDGTSRVHRSRACAKGLALLLDPAFDARESWTALRNGYFWNPTRRATNDFITANFDALAKTVGRDTPGGWPVYASGLCTESDRAKLAAFWRERAPRYAGADRELANAVETIVKLAPACARRTSATGSTESPQPSRLRRNPVFEGQEVLRVGASRPLSRRPSPAARLP